MNMQTYVRIFRREGVSLEEIINLEIEVKEKIKKLEKKEKESWISTLLFVLF